MRTASYAIGLILLTAPGCPQPGSGERSSTRSRVKLHGPAAGALRVGIGAYNDGRIAEARKHLESALRETRGASRAGPGSANAVTRSGHTRIRAEAYFYLAAVAWDLGEKHKTMYLLKLCRHTDPTYEPTDWEFISPGLRKRFEALK